MQITHKLVATALFAMAGIAPAQEPEAPVAVNLEAVPQQLRERIAQKAKQGESELIRYLQRTRHMHNLRPEQVIKAAEPAPARSEETRVTARADATKP